MQKTTFWIISLLITASCHLQAQTQSFNGYAEDETVLYKMNKQVGQFVRRFNMEEDQFGKRLPLSDPAYHNHDLRKKILPTMFDAYNVRTSGKLKSYFIEDVTAEKAPVFLKFLDKNWFAEVSVTFSAKGKEVDGILYLTLEEENLGSKWIISNAYYPSLNSLFPETDTLEQAKRFLHPQSHELDFMNLHKVLEDEAHIEYYASKSYEPDYLSLFFYLLKTEKLDFKRINSVKFHFLQIDKWYFELSYFNRDDTNSGWLISNLKYVDEEEKEQIIKAYRLCTLDQ